MFDLRYKTHDNESRRLKLETGLGVFVPSTHEAIPETLRLLHSFVECNEFAVVLRIEDRISIAPHEWFANVPETTSCLVIEYPTLGIHVEKYGSLVYQLRKISATIPVLCVVISVPCHKCGHDRFLSYLAPSEVAYVQSVSDSKEVD